MPGTATIPNDFHVWPTAAVDYEQRRALVGHMPTQVLYGERVLVLERRGGWTKIAVPDQPSPLDPRGYPGWVQSGSCGRGAVGGAARTVTAPRARLSTGREVGFGTQLPVMRTQRESFLVRTPTGMGAPARRRHDAAPAHARRPRPQREAVPRPALPLGRPVARGATTARA